MADTVLSCGHPPTPQPSGGIGTGYATDAITGETSCYDCASKAEIELLRHVDRFFAYLSTDNRHVVTWPGGRVGTVTRYTEDSGRWTRFGRVHRRYVQVTDVHGNRWTGTGPVENGNYVRLRRMKERQQ